MTTIDFSDVPARVLAGLGLVEPATLRARFDLPVREGETLLTRSHPIVAGLASYILDAALDPESRDHIAARSGATRTHAVASRTTLLLCRYRFHLTITREGVERPLLAESAAVHAFTGSPSNPAWLPQDEAVALLDAVPSGNVAPRAATDFLKETVNTHSDWADHLEEVANEQAEELVAQYRAAREAAAATGRFRVEPQLPVDILGLYVLLPDTP